MADIRRALKAAAKALERASRLLGKSALGGSRGPASAASPRKLSRKARAALQLQGRYLGFVRQLPPRQRALIRVLREKKGVHAAINRARQLARKRRAA
jgi:hypothetical protein